MYIWPYLNSLIIKKLPFLNKNMSKFFPLPSSSRTCACPFDFVLERNPKNIFYCQRDVENFTDQVFNFLLFDRHWIFRIWITLNLPVCNPGQYTYVTDLCNFCFVLFKIWLTESILISREQLFRGTCFLLASNTLRHKFFPM